MNNPSFWADRRVLITGHTGFKGAWLSLCLAEMGAKVSGLALAPESHPSLYDLAGVEGIVASRLADINDRGAVEQLFRDEQPEILFHLAAQALVRPSYADPIGTFAANVGGVITLLDVARHHSCVRAIVIVTSDKCYDNREWVWGYRESDALGGHDPYSASKGCAEIAARSMYLSYFGPSRHPARLATVRAGNVIGGGDWSRDRLIPDIVRGCLGPTGEVYLRNPNAVRPWQHVLDPLAAYIRIAELLETGAEDIDQAWNIGPDTSDNRAVVEVAEAFVAGMGAGRIVRGEVPEDLHEAQLLTLDCAKAKSRLGWRPRLTFKESVDLTVDWYAAWHRGESMADVTRAQLATFMRRDYPAGGRGIKRTPA